MEVLCKSLAPGKKASGKFCKADRSYRPKNEERRKQRGRSVRKQNPHTHTITKVQVQKANSPPRGGKAEATVLAQEVFRIDGRVRDKPSGKG